MIMRPGGGRSGTPSLVATTRKAASWIATAQTVGFALVLFSRRWLSKYAPDHFVALTLEAPAVAEHNALRSPRMDFCECCFGLSPL
jgi:hypothetical protein